MTYTLGVVNNNIDSQSSIGSIARWVVREGLERNWSVTVICRDLDRDLAAQVRHLRLYVPPRVHILQWSVARLTMRAALRGWRPDALLVYQPQLAAIADVWHVSFLSRAAQLAGSPRAKGVRPWITALERAGIAALEDRYIRRLPISTRLLFCSQGLRDEFEAIYGVHSNAGVLYNPALMDPAMDGRMHDVERRTDLTRGHTGPVVGFLGGGDLRKGGDLLLRALAAEPELFLLYAGPGSLDVGDGPVHERVRYLGHLASVDALLSAIDVLVVPSRFEPFGLVVAEAAAYGVPVLVGPRVGAAPLVVETGAGAIWWPPAPLGAAIDSLLARRDRVQRGDGCSWNDWIQMP